MRAHCQTYKKIIGLGLVLFILVLSACSSNQKTEESVIADEDSKETTELTIGLVGGKILDDLPIYIAEEKGYFLDEGIELEIIYHGGMPDSRDAFVSGDTDVAVLSLNFLSLLRQEDVNSSFVSVFTDTAPWELVVSKSSGIEDVDDLPGKSIHTGTSGTLADGMVRQLLRENNIDEKDVDFASGSIDSQVPGLASEKIDGAVLVEPSLSQAIAEDIGDSVYSFADMMKGYSTAHLAMHDDFIEENEDVVNSFQKSLNKALDYIHENEEEVYTLGHEKIYTDMSEEVFDLAFERYYPIFREDVYYTKDTYEGERDLVIKFNLAEDIPFDHEELSYIGK